MGIAPIFMAQDRINHNDPIAFHIVYCAFGMRKILCDLRMTLSIQFIFKKPACVCGNNSSKGYGTKPRHRRVPLDASAIGAGSLGTRYALSQASHEENVRARIGT